MQSAAGKDGREERNILELLSEKVRKKIDVLTDTCLIGHDLGSDIRIRGPGSTSCTLDYRENTIKVNSGKVIYNKEFLDSEKNATALLVYPSTIAIGQTVFRITKEKSVQIDNIEDGTRKRDNREGNGRKIENTNDKKDEETEPRFCAKWQMESAETKSDRSDLEIEEANGETGRKISDVEETSGEDAKKSEEKFKPGAKSDANKNGTNTERRFSSDIALSGTNSDTTKCTASVQDDVRAAFSGQIETGSEEDNGGSLVEGIEQAEEDFHVNDALVNGSLKELFAQVCSIPLDNEDEELEPETVSEDKKGGGFDGDKESGVNSSMIGDKEGGVDGGTTDKKTPEKNTSHRISIFDSIPYESTEAVQKQETVGTEELDSANVVRDNVGNANSPTTPPTTSPTPPANERVNTSTQTTTTENTALENTINKPIEEEPEKEDEITSADITKSQEEQTEEERKRPVRRASISYQMSNLRKRRSEPPNQTSSAKKQPKSKKNKKK